MVEFDDGERKTFVWADYVVFAAMLVISAGIGIYYALSGGKQKTTQEFLMANRSMQIFPVAVSILVSFMSAILILGTPAEMYNKGTQYWIYMFGMILAVILASTLFVPLLYPLQLTSSYEYLELRFRSKAAKFTGTIIMFVLQIIYMGIVLFSPSTALEAVTGFPVWATIIINGLVATFYTTLGGMKAVVWTDVFQSLVMAGGLLAIVIKGSIDVGGIDKVWRLSYEGGRIEFFDFDPDPTKRHSFWSLIVGGAIGWLSTYGVNQASVQRYCSLPTKKKAQMSVLLNIPGLIFLMTITCLTGIVLYAYYANKGCDPYKAGFVSNPNQTCSWPIGSLALSSCPGIITLLSSLLIVTMSTKDVQPLIPYFVLEVLGYPGLPGLFLSCLFSGALSSMSSSLNALAAVTWEDILKPYLGHLSDIKQTIITKVLVAIYGCAGIGFAFMAQNLGGTVLQASLSFTGAASGPLLGLFILGSCFPCANWIGAVIGGILGLALPMWISTGAYIVSPYRPNLNTTVENCTIKETNVTTTASTLIGSTVLPTPARGVADMIGIEKLYTISYLWYPAIGMATVVVVGLLVSCITGFDDPEEQDPELHLPIFEKLMCCLPNKSLDVLRCGVPKADDKPVDLDAPLSAFATESSAKYGVDNMMMLGSTTENDPPPEYDSAATLEKHRAFNQKETDTKL